jgi:hypothetical protein
MVKKSASDDKIGKNGATAAFDLADDDGNHCIGDAQRSVEKPVCS